MAPTSQELEPLRTRPVHIAWEALKLFGEGTGSPLHRNRSRKGSGKYLGERLANSVQKEKDPSAGKPFTFSVEIMKCG